LARPPFFAEGDQAVNETAQFFCLRQGGDDLLVLDESRSHVCKHRTTVLSCDAEFTAGITMTHGYVSFFTLRFTHEADCESVTLYK